MLRDYTHVSFRGCQIWQVAYEVRQSDDNTAKGQKCMQNIKQTRLELFRLSYFNSDVFIEKKGSQSLVPAIFGFLRSSPQVRAMHIFDNHYHCIHVKQSDMMWERLFDSAAKRKDFHSQNNSATTDLLIYVDNIAYCSVFFNSE